MTILPDAFVSIVVCTYKRPKYLKDVLMSLASQSYPLSRYEILVVDNGCDDEIKSIVADRSAGAEVVYVSEPRVGLAWARNTGARHASGEYVAFIDDDATASSFWLSGLSGAFARGGPLLGAVGGPIELNWEVPRPEWLVDKFLPLLGYLNRGAQPRELGDHEWLFGGNMAFRAAALRDVGGFSPGLGRIGRHLLSNEEVLLQMKLAADGYGRLYDPAVLIWHSVPEDRLTPEWFMSRFYWQGVSEAITFRLAGDVALSCRIKNAAFDAAALARNPPQLSALMATAVGRQGTNRLVARCAASRRLGLIKGWLCHLGSYDA